MLKDAEFLIPSIGAGTAITTATRKRWNWARRCSTRCPPRCCPRARCRPRTCASWPRAPPAAPSPSSPRSSTASSSVRCATSTPTRPSTPDSSNWEATVRISVVQLLKSTLGPLDATRTRFRFFDGQTYGRTPTTSSEKLYPGCRLNSIS